MFRTSRSSSQNSLNNDGTDSTPLGEPNLINAQEQMGADIDPPLAASIKFTKEHPIGAILIKLAQDNTALAKKTNLRGVETNINDLCTSFHTAIQLDKADLENKMIQKHADIEQSIIDKDLNSHKLNSTVQPPEYFSPTPKINTPAKLAEVLKLFPRNLKFSGSKQENSMSIIEFLNTLKTAQEQLQLSEKEFIDRMLACSTGHAHELILEWRANGEDIPSIYHSLLVNFDKRLAPEDAKNQLSSYKIPKNATLAKAESHIMVLAGRTASALPEGPSRTAYYNMEAKNAIISALPPTSSGLVSNLYHQLSAKLVRAATFAELSRAMNVYRVTIDKDIKLNGGDNTFRNKNISNTRPKTTGISSRKKFVTYQMSAINASRQRIDGQKYAPKIHQNNPTSYTPRPANISRPFYNKSSSNYSASNSRNNMRKATPAHGKDGKFLKNRLGSSHGTNSGCSLCGLQGHRSKDCKYMQNDSGKKVDIIPTYGTCSHCPTRVHPRLHHPESLCPYRLGGPLHGKF